MIRNRQLLVDVVEEYEAYEQFILLTVRTTLGNKKIDNNELTVLIIYEFWNAKLQFKYREMNDED